jgi:hypothetical protein
MDRLVMDSIRGPMPLSILLQYYGVQLLLSDNIIALRFRTLAHTSHGGDEKCVQNFG